MDMINQKELRIGNYVMLTDGDIVPIQDGGILAIGQKRFTCYPIRLSFKMMEDLGFKPQEDTFDWTLGYVFNINEEFTIISRNDCFYYINAINTQIKYVHQLQNLYFALTNEELTFKP